MDGKGISNVETAEQWKGVGNILLKIKATRESGRIYIILTSSIVN
jgi:hypothetical protein